FLFFSSKTSVRFFYECFLIRRYIESNLRPLLLVVVFSPIYLPPLRDLLCNIIPYFSHHYLLSSCGITFSTFCSVGFFFTVFLDAVFLDTTFWDVVFLDAAFLVAVFWDVVFLDAVFFTMFFVVVVVFLFCFVVCVCFASWDFFT